MNDPEVLKKIEHIESLSHIELCRLWRFAPVGHEYFDSNLPYYEVFERRLFKEFGGFTPEISKLLS